MSVADVEKYSTSLRVASTVTFIFSAGGPAITSFLLYSAAHTDKSVFVLLLQIFCFLNVVGSSAGWITMNASLWQETSLVMLCFGPGYLLGPRVVHAIDFVSMLANVWTPALIVEMMICRTLIVYDTRYSKRTLLMATSIPIIYSFAICLPSLNYLDIDIMRENMTDDLINQTYQHVSYGVGLGELGYDLWNIDTFMRGVMVIICFFMAILMIVKLHSLRVSMSKATRKVHTAFVIILSFDAAVVLVYYLGSNTGTFALLAEKYNYLAILTNTFSYPFFTFGPAIQSVALLYLVPYLRAAVKRIVLRQHNSVSFIPSITTEQF